MWVNISAKAKTIVLPHKTRGGNTSQILSCTHIHNYCRKHRKFMPNSSSYTIEHKIVRNSHLLLHKIGIFSSATAIVLQTSVNCSYAKSSKQQLTAHMSIVKGDMTKCYKHVHFLFKCTIVFTGVKKSIDIIAKYKTNKFYA